MSIGNSSRTVFIPAVAALAVIGVFAGGPFASRARAEDGARPHADKQELIEEGRELFNTWSCSACHTLSDAGSSGAVGPSLDNPQLTHDYIVNRVTNGSGPMPSFGGQIDEKDIGELADYIVAVNHKGSAAPATH